MKNFYRFFFLLFIFISKILFSQNQSSTTEQRRYDDINGKIITDENIIKTINAKRQNAIAQEQKRVNRATATQNMVEMCTNGGFEQYETISGKTYLKNFLYATGDQSGPTECRAITNIADLNINAYDPNNANVMTTTVPANYIDLYMGDIKAFDQYALKVNYDNSYSMSASVQGKRFKTNNEDFLKFKDYPFAGIYYVVPPMFSGESDETLQDGLVMEIKDAFENFKSKN